MVYLDGIRTQLKYSLFSRAGTRVENEYKVDNAYKNLHVCRDVILQGKTYEHLHT